MQYKVIKSARKTFSVQIKDGAVLVRCPLSATRRQIELFLRRNAEWIDRHMEKAMELQREAGEKLTEAELRELHTRAKEYIPGRVRFWAEKLRVSYGRITIRRQHTRWGSCSTAGNLNFNCLLMLAPPEVIDSVVVHELCHRKEMNHSHSFYAELNRVFPGYEQCRSWLKDKGPGLMARLP